jgi:tetratricopeptide (TPR) repeat protein
LARVQLKLKDYASGIENLNIILQKKTDNTDALDSRGFLYLKMKAYKKAEADLQKAIQLNPQQDLAWANLGLLFTAQGDWLQALTHLDKAVMLNPNEVYSLNSRAWARLQQNQLEKAEADILASLRLNEEDNAAAYRNKGILEYKRKNNPEAVKYLREALTQDSTDELTLQYLKELQKH